MAIQANEKVIDFNSARQQRTQAMTQQSEIKLRPMLVWCPMWVMVPEQTVMPSPES